VTAIRLAEIVGMLAAGQDQAFGQPVGSELRSCLIATRGAESMGLAEADRAAVYWVALLRYLGCTGHVVIRISVVGDERAGAFGVIVAEEASGRDGRSRDRFGRVTPHLPAGRFRGRCCRRSPSR
jgi:hypothetical protein